MTPAAPSFDAHQRIQHALHQDEQVKWSGRPAPGAMATSHRMAGVMGSMLMGLLFFHLVISPLSPLKAEPSPDRSLNLIAILFMMGVAIFFIRLPWRKLKELRHTLYVLTDHRVIILHPQKNKRNRSMPLTAIDAIQQKKATRNTFHLHLKPNVATPHLPAAPQVPQRPFQLRFLRQSDALIEQLNVLAPNAKA